MRAYGELKEERTGDRKVVGSRGRSWRRPEEPPSREGSRRRAREAVSTTGIYIYSPEMREEVHRGGGDARSRGGSGAD